MQLRPPPKPEDASSDPQRTVGMPEGASARVETPLRGWRQIAAFLGRDESTVRRWAATRGLPVFRVGKGRRGQAVHAYASELEAWIRAEVGRGGMGADMLPPPGSPEAPASAGSAGAASQTTGLIRREILRVAAGAAIGFGLGAASVSGGILPLRVRGMPDDNAVEAEVPAAARDLYVRGSFLLSRRSRPAIAGAIRELGQAIDIHPHYAEALGALATGYNLAPRYGVMSGWEAYPRAERAARNAAEIDAGLEPAQSALAYVEFRWHWGIAASLARFEEILRRSPASVNALFWHAEVLLHLDRGEEALPLARKAAELDPYSSATRTLYAYALFLVRRSDASIAALREIIARDPGYAWPYHALYLVNLARGDHRLALENYSAFGERLEIPRYRAVASAGLAGLDRAGVEGMADAMAELEAVHYQRGDALAFEVARHHAVAGRASDVVFWLGISLKRHESPLVGILADPAFRPLRNDAGFLALLTEIGLLQDGKARGGKAHPAASSRILAGSSDLR